LTQGYQKDEKCVLLRTFCAWAGNSLSVKCIKRAMPMLIMLGNSGTKF